MGAEGSFELFEENQLENELGMMKDESLKDMFNRSLANMVDVLVHPIRFVRLCDCSSSLLVSLHISGSNTRRA
jgi:hypothetical protein